MSGRNAWAGVQNTSVRSMCWLLVAVLLSASASVVGSNFWVSKEHGWIGGVAAGGVLHFVLFVHTTRAYCALRFRCVYYSVYACHCRMYDRVVCLQGASRNSIECHETRDDALHPNHTHTHSYSMRLNSKHHKCCKNMRYRH